MQFRTTECGQTWLQNFNDSQNDVFPWDGEMRTQRTLAPMSRGNKPQVELQIVVARLTVARPCWMPQFRNVSRGLPLVLGGAVFDPVASAHRILLSCFPRS